jgi:hypothetical protein
LTTKSHAAKYFVLSLVTIAASIVLNTAANGDPSPAPSVAASGASAASPSPSPSPTPKFYNMINDIDTTGSVDRDATLFYYFQGNTDGTGKAKYELRYGRDLWNDNAILRIRIPFLTKYPTIGNPYTGLGNVELGYSYSASSPKFNHSLEIRGSFPTAANNVSSNDTQLKGFYTTKWKLPGFAITYLNEYDQSIIVPPGSSWTSYYEGKLTLPDYAFPNLKGLNFSAFYNFRELFDSGGKFKDALGGTLYGNLNNAVAVSVFDSWGLGGNASSLWRYKFEVNLTGKF